MRQNNLGIACLLEPFPRDISYTARPSAVERILLVKMEVERHDLAQDFSLLLCGPDLSVFSGRIIIFFFKFISSEEKDKLEIN